MLPGAFVKEETPRSLCENGLAERVNGILKEEYGLGEEFASATQARRALEQAVSLYNTRRPHVSLNYRTPEAVHREATRNAHLSHGEVSTLKQDLTTATEDGGPAAANGLRTTDN